MKGVKIVTIGGGSSYTPELVEGFIKRYAELPVKELWLVDIEEGKEKLKTVKNCVQMLGSFLLQILLESMLKQCLDILAGKNLLGYVMDL